MKKFSFLVLQLVAVALIFTSCGVHDDNAEYYVKWDSDNGGTLEVINTSNKDIVVFSGQIPTKESIMGGVRAGATKTFDVSKHVSDFNVGGYMILRGIDREEFNQNMNDLSEAKVEFNAMATYKAGEKYRITMDRNFMGDFAIRITNRGQLGLELRKDSPEGEKVAYLPRLKVNQMLYTQTSDAITLFPVYVVYNKTTQEIITLNATSMFEAVTATPREVSKSNMINNYSFPNDPTLSWEKILGTLKSPVAYITVSNNVMNQGAYFTNAGSTRYSSQDGYNAIGSGEQLVFEVKAEDYDEESKTGGIEKNLLVSLYGGVIEVPVLSEKVTEVVDGEGTRNDTTYITPTIKNGYNYTVSISGSGQDSKNYKAIIKEGKKRDLSGNLESL